MRHLTILPQSARPRRHRRILAGCVILAAMAASPAFAATPPPGFASPDEAVAALVSAARSEKPADLERLLGPGSDRLVESGDPVSDKEGRERFVAAYDEQHAVEPNGDSKATLVVGHEDWPMPIPVVKEGSLWRFDAAAGAEEILARRVGHNERRTIATCRAYVEAQLAYAAQDRDGDGIRDYAQLFLSSDGKHDGLYWPADAGAEESPIGPLVANARAEGYAGRGVNTQETPYHGYFFKILTRQGPHAPGGAYDYVANGHMIGGFALIAFPANWGDSGIMSFIVGQDGRVLEKNLGSETGSIARAMTEYDPDQSWHAAVP
ncbi:MAG TPA: DUF2950 domain-containing protein [Stellaceae bacterium]|nr:DUF2950 domain-containing protein [Stellaceae bacterium]